MVEQGRLTQLRQLVRDAVSPAREVVESSETKAHRDFRLHEFNAGQAFVVEQTTRARAIREITRIATWYGWPGEMARALDAAGAESLQGLGELELDALVSRMRLLEECVQNGGDAPDAPPAR